MKLNLFLILLLIAAIIGIYAYNKNRSTPLAAPDGTLVYLEVK